MKIAIILSGTLNTFYQNHLEENIHFLTSLKKQMLILTCFVVQKKGHFKEETPRRAREFAQKNKIVNEWPIKFVYDNYLVCEKEHETIVDEIKEVFPTQLKKLQFVHFEIEKTSPKLGYRIPQT